MKENAAGLFSLHWNTYRKIVAENYMQHRAFLDEAKKIIDVLSQKGKVQVLDLGCGDAAEIAALLMSCKDFSYTGYDLARPVLGIAELNLLKAGSDITLKNGDMRKLVTDEKNRFHFIFSCFAVHHLQDHDKRSLLERCYDLLLPGGKFLLVDVFRNRDQTHDGYLDDYLRMIGEKWPALGSGELELIQDHIREYDFPAVYGEVYSWAKAIGFEATPGPAGDSFHKMLLLSKP